MELSTINTLQDMIAKELKNRVVELEQLERDSLSQGWYQNASEYKGAARELEMFRYKISTVCNALFLDTLEQMELNRPAPVTKLDSVNTEKTTVELPEITAKDRTIGVTAG